MSDRGWKDYSDHEQWQIIGIGLAILILFVVPIINIVMFCGRRDKGEKLLFIASLIYTFIVGLIVIILKP